MAENKGKTRQQIETYVNSTCASFLEPHSEYISIAFRGKGTEESYIRVMTAADEVRLFNITEMTLEEVCVLIVKMVANEHIQREITDKAKRTEVSALFRTPQKAVIGSQTSESYVFDYNVSMKQK